MFIIKYLDRHGVEQVLCRVLSEAAAIRTMESINRDPWQTCWYEPCEATL